MVQFNFNVMTNLKHLLLLIERNLYALAKTWTNLNFASFGENDNDTILSERNQTGSPDRNGYWFAFFDAN